MYNSYFRSVENSANDIELLFNEVIDELMFNDQGLIPVITQDAESKKVLMLAWMNKDALKTTLTSSRMTYWSRSRNQLWIKGETSGCTQALISMSFDCDGDSVLCLVDQKGAACHTGRKDCFYLEVDRKNTSSIKVNVKGTSH